jgi:outer membrane protein OmpA-like peptidoglycan-associated protein
MLNSKPFVLIVFLIWSAICWRWYVCGIKKACEVTASVNTETGITPVARPPAVKPDSAIRKTSPNVAHAPAVAPPPAAYNKAENPLPKSTKPYNAGNIDKAQVESSGDRLVIHFPYNSIRKDDNAEIEAYLSRLAAQLVSSGDKVTITGHTDFVGDAKSNHAFGLRRANSIGDILIKKGVKKSQIICKSFGDRKPVATNDTAQGRYQNRRVEIKLNR